jgi:hypothetical protein
VAATLVGWLLTDALLVPGERSPLLGALAAPWRGTPALGVLVAFVLGVGVGGAGWLLARRGTPPSPERMRSGDEQPVDSVDA